MANLLERRTSGPSTMTRSEMNLRGALYVVLGVLAFLLSNTEFQGIVGHGVIITLGAVNAAALALRMFIDKSVPEAQAPTPTEVKEQGKALGQGIAEASQDSPLNVTTDNPPSADDAGFNPPQHEEPEA